MKNKRNYYILLFTAVGILIAFFIFRNSMQSVAASTVESKRIVSFLLNIFGKLDISDFVTDHNVRKLAHLTEFAFLGANTAFLCICIEKNPKLNTIPHALLFLLLCGLTDETIQKFTGRGSLVSDVWIDFIGGILGFFFVVIISGFISKKKKL